MIAVVDYGLGNVGAIINMLRRIGCPAKLAGTPGEILAASGMILPGVGAFDHGMAQLEKQGLRGCLDRYVTERRGPVLGICLGMQLMTRRSDEGRSAGLAWIDAETIAFSNDPAVHGRLRVPHMGWSSVRLADPGPLFARWSGDARFYFVHSYRIVVANGARVTAVGWHGSEFVAGFQRDLLFGVQFHPEKSHRFGMRLLQNFAQMAQGGKE